MTSIHQYRFYGCYLLISENESAPRGRSYIGFTVNPARRIRQHNGDLSCGGARKTKLLRPWRMVCIVHGFRSHVQGLQFEWGWQHPLLFRSVRTAVMAANIKGCKLSSRGRQREMKIETNLEVLAAMLSSVPWSRMPLLVTFFDSVLQSNFSALSFPSTIRVSCLQSLSSLDVTPGITSIESNCFVCGGIFDSKISTRVISCPGCCVMFHPRCVASSSHLVPTEDVSCPACLASFTWTGFVRNAFIVGTPELDEEDELAENDHSEEEGSVSPIRTTQFSPVRRVLVEQQSNLDHFLKPQNLSSPTLRERLFERTKNKNAFKIYCTCVF